MKKLNTGKIVLICGGVICLLGLTNVFILIIGVICVIGGLILNQMEKNQK